VGYYSLGDSSVVTSFFNLVRVHNSGAAFSFLAGASGWQRWFFTAIGLLAAGLIVWMLRAHAGQKLFSFALACILGEDSRLIDLAIIKRRAPMNAVRLQQAGPAGCVTEDDEVFTEDADLLRRGRHLRGDIDRMPIAPQPFSGGRSGPHFQQFFFGVARHKGAPIGAAVAISQKL